MILLIDIIIDVLLKLRPWKVQPQFHMADRPVAALLTVRFRTVNCCEPIKAPNIKISQRSSSSTEYTNRVYDSAVQKLALSEKKVKKSGTHFPYRKRHPDEEEFIESSMKRTYPVEDQIRHDSS